MDRLARDVTPDEAILQIERRNSRAGVQLFSLSGFTPGNIISDTVFYARSTMTETQIQTFLNERVPRCDPGYTCLKDFRQTTPSRAADAYCGAYQGGANETAARIIHKVAQACAINPQVLLVMLQKEQSLVTHHWPSDWRYTWAMGMACPDTAACDARYAGFFNQVYGAARQMQIYAKDSYFNWYPVGRTSNVRYHPDASCGSAPVHIENQATASLYYYTPYQPNRAALNAGYGEGDACSSYGNRNFYNYFTDWFGSTQQISGIPFGWVNQFTPRPGTIYLKGWAIDPDTTGPIKVHVHVGGVWRKTFLANQWRTDIGANYPDYGPNHAFSGEVPFTGLTTQKVCLIAENVGAGSNRTLGCSWETPRSGNPFGWVNEFRPVPGGVYVKGWAIDPDTTGTVKVHVHVGGVWRRTILANEWRVDVGANNPLYGANHAFYREIPLSRGTQRVCLIAENIGVGVNHTLACRWLTI
ncbi:hypothetical protein [Microbacterium album]|uniref:Uncharacterized protein n=1 Tax=Microbacterium album TaxID=2053191 RepID=A0A917MKL7_9MICO|nr:hypothetical protein [Microbacterium album]GGH37521.1 hypothetical protein GCM10010921_07440 [Microbacterium album]